MSESHSQYDHIGSKYEDYAHSATLKRAERHNIARLVGDLTGKRILDLACGTGYYTRWLKQHGAEEIHGMDISAEMIRVANQIENDQPLGITYKVGDAADLSGFGSYDLITAVWLFNYVKSEDEMVRMFQTCFDHLNSQGCLATYTINPSYNINGPNMTKYGIQIIRERIEEGRYALDGEFLTDPPAAITVYRWSQAVYEQAVNQAGFTSLTWQTSEVALEDTEHYGKEYWQDYYDNCIGIGLKCQK